MTQRFKRIIGLILVITMLSSLLLAAGISVSADNASGITEEGGWLESAYVEWASVDGATGYNVYVKSTSASAWTRIDDMLIRKYPTYWRADAVGLKAGTYQLKIVPVTDGTENESAALTTGNLTVLAHDRSGYAFVNGSSSGAYNDDGTLKSNARVIYVTESNKNTVSMSVQTGKSTFLECKGPQEILTALKKGYETDPVCIRFIGNVTDPATLEKGDLLIDLGEGKFTGGLTVEGIGEDTVLNGFGIRIKSSSNVEIRNLAVMNCDSDEGDSISLQQDNDHIWVHNCDIFYGCAGSDADQEKGDGALDTKKSTYITHSYNHFWDCGKSCLLGNNGESTDNYLTYHHNWFDHSDSRHPRVRTSTVHVYNNFYDGIAKYGVGATEGASIFSEANYFLNSKNPLLISMQGTDIADGEGTFSSEDGGIIKSYADVFVNSSKVVGYNENNTEFDAYIATSRNETVPSTVMAKKGGSTYNNFDTASGFYSYTPDTAEQAMQNVKAYAGRVNGGDFKWTFASGSESLYDVDPALKAAVTSYKGSIVSYGGNDDGYTGGGTGSGSEGGSGSGSEGGSGSGSTGGGTTFPAGAYLHNFTSDGKNSTFYTISGNLSTSKGTVIYNGLTLTQCLKMETSTSISFNAPAAGTLTLVFVDAIPNIKVDGEKITGSNGIITVDVASGDHTITKADSMNLFYMAYVSAEEAHDHNFVDGTCSVCGEAQYASKYYNFVYSDVTAGADKDAIAAGTTYGNGYFTVVGTVTQRVKNGAVYCVEVAKNSTGAIRFTVATTAKVVVQFSSTGSSNTSAIGIANEYGAIMENVTGVYTVTGTSSGMTEFTYYLPAGTYDVVSPASDPDYNRGARLYYVNVEEGVKLDGHIHYFVASNRVEPDCVNAGSCDFACQCGEKYTETYNAKGHSFVDGTCSRCGAADPDYVAPDVPDHTHSYEAAVTAPTCTVAGYTTYTCSCGDSYTADEVAALGHDFVDGTCSRCGAADPDYVAPDVPDHTHSYEAAVTAPTCTEGGYTTYTCSCGDSYTADEVAALGHDFVDGTCSRCGIEDPTDPDDPTDTDPTNPEEPEKTTIFQKIGAFFSKIGEAISNAFSSIGEFFRNLFGGSKKE